jgi:N-acetyl-D-muramate 6-phosphate phosphatase
LRSAKAGTAHSTGNLGGEILPIQFGSLRNRFSGGSGQEIKPKMQTSLRAVFFDADGVLIDSLPQHLQICRDKAVEFGLRLKIPSADEFRELVRRGVKVSPMRYFFLAVGFPEDLVERAVADYEKDFMQRYQPRAFVGVDKMLAACRRAGLNLGLVTSNTRANVVPALGSAIEFFDERCRFYFDRYPEPKTKPWCLLEGARLLGVGPPECVFVGDQPVDAAAAREAGTRFLGVTYGWGISQHDKHYETVKSILEISDKLIGLHAQP